MRVTWTPKTVFAWTWGDEWGNEFSSYLDRALTDREMELYFEWSLERQSGEVIEERHSHDFPDEDLLVIKLDVPLTDELTTVAYMRRVVFGDGEPEFVPHPKLSDVWRRFVK